MRTNSSSHQESGSNLPNHDPRHSYRALWAHGFRPFFLSAAAMGAFALLLWVSQLQGLVVLGGAYGAVGWHAHEMLFGYTIAVIAGFLLTAVRNWTRLPTASGLRLAMLAAVWLAGRLVMLATAVLPPASVAVVDVAFLPALAAALAPSLWRARVWRNLLFVGLIGVLALANLAFHLAALGIYPGGAALGLRLGLGVVVMMMVIVGGRVIPGFTRNAFLQSGVHDWPWASRLAIASTALYLACLLLPVDRAIMAAVTLAAAVANGMRMIPWRPFRTGRVPIVWVLHLGYGWIVAGLGLSAAAEWLSWLPPTAGTHALGMGAIGTTTLGMMSRVALGHTGRALVTGSPIMLAYALMTLAAVLRVAAAFSPPQTVLLTIAGLSGAGAFVIFIVVYWPILMRSRVD